MVSSAPTLAARNAFHSGSAWEARRASMRASKFGYAHRWTTSLGSGICVTHRPMLREYFSRAGSASAIARPHPAALPGGRR